MRSRWTRFVGSCEFESFQIDEETGVVTVRYCQRATGEMILETTCRVLVGADGIHSRVRRQLLLDDGKDDPAMVYITTEPFFEP
jgi:2-polyprenyl-6-methoxyphenol hydroxylase-like FAD-dependent oxidoreductase